MVGDKYLLDKILGARKIPRMDEPFFRFWDRPLDWVADQCKALDIKVTDLVCNEAGIGVGLWRKWLAGACEPTFRRFKPIVYAIERAQIAKAEADKKEQAKAKRAAARRSAR